MPENKCYIRPLDNSREELPFPPTQAGTIEYGKGYVLRCVDTSRSQDVEHGIQISALLFAAVILYVAFRELRYH